MKRKRPSTKPVKTSRRHRSKPKASVFDPVVHALTVVNNSCAPVKNRIRMGLSLLRSNNSTVVATLQELASSPRVVQSQQDRISAALLDYQIRVARADRAEDRATRQAEEAAEEEATSEGAKDTSRWNSQFREYLKRLRREPKLRVGARKWYSESEASVQEICDEFAKLDNAPSGRDYDPDRPRVYVEVSHEVYDEVQEANRRAKK